MFIQLAPAFIAVLIAIYLGGSARGLAQRIVAWPLGLGAVVLDLLLVRVSPADHAWVSSAGHWLWVGGIVAVLTVLLANAQQRRGFARMAWLVAGAGVALNLAVILANGGYMPIGTAAAEETNQTAELTSTSRYVREIAMTPDTRLPLLADILAEPTWMPGKRTVNSVGDVLLALGLAAWAFHATYSFRRTVTARPDRDLRAPLHAELAEDVFHVGLHRLGGQYQRLGDIAVRPAEGNQVRDFPFTWT
jgi:hypothetical protein